MTKEIQKQIMKEIDSYERIIIHRHQRPDPDAIGSQCGLAALIEATYPQKKVLRAGSSSGSLKFLRQMDQVKDEDYRDALVIVTDTANASRVDDDRYTKGQKIIKIDHHPHNDEGDYADLSWEDDRFSSCSEMIALMWKNFEEYWQMTAEAARLLYAGIVGDTNRFLYDATSSQTMHLAGELMNYDFNHTALNDQMNRISLKEARLQAYLYENLTLLDSGMAYLILTEETMNELDIKDEHTHSIVALPRAIEGVQVWGIFVQQADHSFRCRLRSSGPSINQIAEAHGGGGHALASGAQAEDQAEVQEIIEELSELSLKSRR